MIGPSGGEGQIGLFARKAWQQPAAAAAPVETPAEKSWLIFADASGLGEQLATQLRAAGARCRIARPGKQFAATGADTFTLRAEAPEDWTQLLAACATAAPVERIIYLWGLDAPAEVADALMGTDALLHLSQALEATNPGGKVRIDPVTRGAQPVGRETAATAVAQAPGVGLFRVILNEYSNLSCRGIDLPPVASESDAALLWSELLRNDAEREIAFRGEARYAQRLTRGRPSVRAVARSGGAVAPRIPRARPPRHAALRAVRAARLRAG